MFIGRIGAATQLSGVCLLDGLEQQLSYQVYVYWTDWSSNSVVRCMFIGRIGAATQLSGVCLLDGLEQQLSCQGR